MISGSSAAAILEKVRREKPLIHHLTNFVTMGDCATVTKSLGALPVMAQAEEEVEEMVSAARAAVINTGTLTPSRVRAMYRMGMTAQKKGIPVVFDPVGAGATSYRTQEIIALLRELRPPLIKGNKAEIACLGGMHDVKIRGIEALHSNLDPLEAAHRLLHFLAYEPVVIITGAVDTVYDSRRTARIYNGNAMLPLVVGSGCMAASVTAAFAAVEHDYFAAATTALAALGVAAELAVPGGENAVYGPAVFKIRWLDTLFSLTQEQLEKGARIVVQK